MNKNIFKFLKLICLIVLFGGFSVSLAKANGDFILEKSTDCNIQYMGDICVIEMKITNNVGEDLSGEAILKVEYGDQLFDGEGIYVSFLPDSLSGNWLESSGWLDGETGFSGFNISQGETPIELKIKTHTALMSGQYTFTFTLNGITEQGEEQTAVIPVGGGGGGIMGMFGTSPSSYPNTNTGTVMATSAQGGRTVLINIDGTQAEIIIPQNAISQNTIFSIKQLDNDSVNQPVSESGLFLIGGVVYEITAQANGDFITQFNQPLTLTFTYTDEQIKNLDENSLEIYYWDKEQNQWVVAGNSIVDENTNSISVSVNHLTIFSLMASEKKSLLERTEEIATSVGEGLLGIGERIIESVIPETIAENESQEILNNDIAETELPKELPKGLVAALGMAWGEITDSFLWSSLVFLCLVILAGVGFKEWKLIRKRNIGRP